MNKVYQNGIIDLLRHGSINAIPGLYGHTDIDVTETGWQQMQQSVFIDLQYHQVISSPLSRCYRFAEDYCQRHLVQLKTNPLLEEMNFGTWDGLTFEQLQQSHDGVQLQKFWDNPIDFPPPGGESLADFHDRVIRAWNELLIQSKGMQTLVVTHAGVIKMIMAHLLCINWQSGEYHQRLRIDYGSMTRIQICYDEDNIYPQIRFIGRSSPAM